MKNVSTDTNTQRFMYHLLKSNPGLSQTYQMFHSLSRPNVSMTTGNKSQTQLKPTDNTIDATKQTL